MRQVVIALCLFGGLSLLGQTLVISEFMADNQTGITDAEGDNSDWIEVENVSANPVDLLGWALTDDPLRLDRWRFPSMSLAAGERLLVFASGKDKRNPDVELHTNFQLANEGEYLAIVRPDGVTVEHAFAPAYPPQPADTSFGFAVYRESAQLLSASTTTRWSIPAPVAGAPNGWQNSEFNDSGWNPGSLALGYDIVAPAPTIGTNLARGRSATQSSTLGSFAASRAVDGILTNFSQTRSGTGTNSLWDVNLGATYLIDAIVLRNRTDCCQSRLRDLLVSVRNATGAIVYYESPLLNPENILGGPSELRLQLTNELTGRISGNRVRITRVMDSDLSGGGTTQDDAEALSLTEVEVFGRVVTNSIAPLVQTDIVAEMRGVASSCLVRVPFRDPWSGQRSFERLLLKIRYNDGYVAYLNGVEVARQNVKDPLSWNTSAATNRAKALAFNFDTVDVSRFAGLIRSDGNVLALRGFSAGTNDGEFLIQPSLEATSIRRQSAQFLDAATPRVANSAGSAGITGSVEFSIPRGFYEQPISLSLSSSTPDAEIRFTLNGSDPAKGGGIRTTNPIRITKPTPVRAVALKTGWKSAPTATHTYVFLNDVIRQTSAATIALGFPTSWGGVSPDYAMDPRVIGGVTADRYGGKYAATIKDDLRSLATLSITINSEDMFGPNGIYSRSDAGGDAYERGSSAELIETNGASLFQINAGLRIQGGAFRSDGLTKKHSLRLVFNSKHGPTKLRYPLFGSQAADRFDTVTLRANSNDAYSWDAAGGQPLYVRDTFGRESILDMNGVASHHKFVHLYINAAYWGLYEIVERPDSAFSSTYFEGEREEWDSLNSGNPTEGDTRAWDAMTALGSRGLLGNSNYFRIQGRNPDGTPNSALPNYLDVPNLIDYMIVNLYMGNSDWPSKNYWVARRRVDSSGYKFYMWDAEWAMGLRSDLSTDQTGVGVGVATPYAACRANPEFRVLFGDHLQKHLFDGGALAVDPLYPTWDTAHPERNRPAERFVRLTEEIRRAMVGESARWGDMHSATPYTRDEHWANERDLLLRSYYPLRSEVVVQQFRRIGLYPSLNPPSFSLRSGLIKPGQTLLMGSSVGKIFYTLDGSDPRLLGGVKSLQAVEYTGPVTLPGRSIIKARVQHTNAWSALREAVFTQADPMPLRITEIHFRPGAEDPASPYFADDFEFIEVKNVGSAPLNLRGVRFTRGVTFDFTAAAHTLLAPGAHAVIARRAAAFEARYGKIAGLVGVFEGALGDAGERLTLMSPYGEVIQDFSYSPASHPTTDGLGFSLVSVDPDNSSTDPDLPGAWRPSSAPGGSPGRDDPATTAPRVVVSEILARAANGGPDAVELQNLGSAPADVSGWFLTDDPAAPKKFQIPSDTVIPPGGWVTFVESQFDPRPRVPTGFALSSGGESVWLFSATIGGVLTGYAHGMSFGASPPGVSFIRAVTSELTEWAVPSSSTTLGAANADPLRGEAIISRLNPDPGPGGIEFVEIHNPTSASLPLYDITNPSSAWRITGIGWTFPTNVMLSAGGYCIIAKGSPEQFRARYGVPPGALLFGPFAGSLQNGGETIELQRPDPGVTPPRWIIVDRVHPRETPSWPKVWGTGAFLARRSAADFGPEPQSWLGSAAAPGQSLDPVGPPEIVGQSEDAAVRAFDSITLQVSVRGIGPSTFQWLHNGEPIPAGTNAQFTLDPVLSLHAGVYEAHVFSSGGMAISRPVLVTVIEGPQFTRFPAPRSVLQGANVSLTAAVSGVGPTRYQWLFGGIPLTGATNTTLDIPSIQLPQAGSYALRVTDDVGVFTSPGVLVEVLRRPAIIEQPQSVAVLQGETVSFRVRADGTGPLTFRWRKNATVLANSVFTLNQEVSTLVLSNVQSASAGRYSVQVTNRAPTGTMVSADATLVILPDTDRDGMEDGWESRYGLNPGDPSDAGIDMDGDGFSNREEYQAGTDPVSRTSTLFIEPIQLRAQSVELGWTAVSNRTYTLLYRVGLQGGEWLRLADIYNRPTSRVETVLDSLPGEGARFYRLVTPAF